MENKLQELTGRIYAEGVLKAQKEGEQIIENARKEAAKGLEDARKEAERIIEQAKIQAEEMKKNVSAEVKLTTSQALSSLKTRITDLITLGMIDTPVKKAFQDNDFMKKLIETLVKGWMERENAGGLQVMLSEKDKKELEDHFQSKLHKSLAEGLEIKSEEFESSGFRIGPMDGSYKISFTEDDFINFIKAYLRPRTHQLLFGGNQ
jgi:V/A-type H+-transporting ATPase subunit E